MQPSRGAMAAVVLAALAATSGDARAAAPAGGPWLVHDVRQVGVRAGEAATIPVVVDAAIDGDVTVEVQATPATARAEIVLVLPDGTRISEDEAARRGFGWEAMPTAGGAAPDDARGEGEVPGLSAMLRAMSRVRVVAIGIPRRLTTPGTYGVRIDAAGAGGDVRATVTTTATSSVGAVLTAASKVVQVGEAVQLSARVMERATALPADEVVASLTVVRARVPDDPDDPPPGPGAPPERELTVPLERRDGALAARFTPTRAGRYVATLRAIVPTRSGARVTRVSSETFQAVAHPVLVPASRDEVVHDHGDVFPTPGQPVSARGIDRDGDGRFEVLRVEVHVGVRSAGSYEWDAALENAKDHNIAFAEASGHLSGSDNVVALEFDGCRIACAAEGGTYRIRDLQVWRGEDSLEWEERPELTGIRREQFGGARCACRTTPPSCP